MGQGAKTNMAAPAPDITKTQDHDICAKCQGGRTNGSQALQLCGRRKNMRCCSRTCQRADLKDHKTVCKDKTTAAGQAGSTGLSVSAVEYYQTVAPNTLEAQRLAREIGLALPDPGGPQQGIR
jgi:hypothetical protein